MSFKISATARKTFFPQMLILYSAWSYLRRKTKGGKKGTFSFWTEECKLLDYLNSQEKNELVHQELLFNTSYAFYLFGIPKWYMHLLTHISVSFYEDIPTISLRNMVYFKMFTELHIIQTWMHCSCSFLKSPH